ncbi:MAG: Clp protease N-terminal domain-containing protein [Verrucomicrobiota bacterium]
MAYSSDLDTALMRARVLAENWTQAEVHNEHVIISLLRNEEFQRTLEAMSVRIGELKGLLREVAGEYREMGDPANDDVAPGEDLMRTLAQAEWYREKSGDLEVLPFHYLMALTAQEGRVAQYIAQFVNQAVRQAHGNVDPENPPTSYSEEILNGLKNAEKVTTEWNQSEIHNEHLIFALCLMKGDFGAQLARTKIQPEDFQERLLGAMSKYPTVEGNSDSNITLGADLRKTLGDAELLRVRTHSDQLIAIHYLMALFEQDGEIAKYIAKFAHQAMHESSPSG